MSQIRTISDVVSRRLCLGCGACAAFAPAGTVQLRDLPTEGIRPVASDPAHPALRDALAYCPVVETDFRIPGATPARPGGPDSIGDATFVRDWGRVLEVWEGHAADPDIRYRASSGGALTALAAYCLEHEGVHGVLQTGPSPHDPLRNQTRLSRNRSGLLEAMGSRYAPASVCDSLGLVEAAPAPCVIVGKPAEIAAVRNVARARPEFSRKVAATFSFFCAESPSTAGTIALLEKMGVSPAEVGALRYRGHGWPGHFAPTRRGEAEPAARMTYQESWAFLQRYRPWSTHLWPDGSGELADISCGDPWYEQPDGKNPGSSLVVVRSERGRAIVRGALAAGYVQLTPAEPWKLGRSQVNLASKKAATWGRLQAMRLLGLPVPRFPGAPLFACWRQLSLAEKFRSTFGTVRRILSRRLHRPLRVAPAENVPQTR